MDVITFFFLFVIFLCLLRILILTSRSDSSGKGMKWAHGKIGFEFIIKYYNVICKVNG